MRHRTALAVLVASLFILPVMRPQAQRTPADSGPVVLRGVVVDAEGAAVSRMRLDVMMGGKRTAGTVTEDDGTFSVAITAPDRVSIAPFANLTLRTFKAGYATTAVTFGPEQVRAPGGVRFTVPRAGVISGRIVSAGGTMHGTMLAASMVIVRRDGDGGTLTQNVFTTRPDQISYSTLPDEDGNFRVGGLPAGRYVVQVPVTIAESAAGQATAANGSAVRIVSTTVDVRPGFEITGVDLVYTPTLDEPAPAQVEAVGGGSLIRGRVTTVEGQPVSGAMVSARTGGRSWHVSTDASGQFTMRDVPPGKISITALRRGYLPAEYGQRGADLPGLPVVVEAGRDVDNVAIMLSRGGVITGIVVDEHNEPLPDVALELSRVRQSATGLVLVASLGGGRTTDDRGMFRIPEVGPGDYLLTASLPAEITTEASGRRTASVPAFYPDTQDAGAALPLRVQAGDVVSSVLTIRRVPVVRVAGVVQNSQGTPFTGTVRLSHRHVGAWAVLPRTAYPDASGAFAFAEVPPGDYVLWASASGGPNGTELAQHNLTVAATDPEPLVMRTMPTSSASGHLVLDSPAGEMLWGYSIRTFTPDTASSGAGMTTVGSPTPNGATFQLASLAGPTRIAVATDDANWYLRSIAINGVDATDVPFDFGFDGRRYTGVEVVFSRYAASLTGRATDDRAMPVNDYAVYAFPIDRDKWFTGSRWLKRVRSAGDGTFRVAGLPPGEYWLAAVDRVDTAAASRDWVDVDLLDALAARATRTILAEGQSRTATLRLVRR